MVPNFDALPNWNNHHDTAGEEEYGSEEGSEAIRESLHLLV